MLLIYFPEDGRQFESEQECVLVQKLLWTSPEDAVDYSKIRPHYLAIRRRLPENEILPNRFRNSTDSVSVYLVGS